MALLTTTEIVTSARDAARLALAEARALRTGIAAGEAYSAQSLLSMRRILRRSLAAAGPLMVLPDPQAAVEALVPEAPQILPIFGAAQIAGESARQWIEAALNPDPEGNLHVLVLTADGEDWRQYSASDLAPLLPLLDSLIAALEPLG